MVKLLILLLAPAWVFAATGSGPGPPPGPGPPSEEVSLESPIRHRERPHNHVTVCTTVGSMSLEDSGAVSVTGGILQVNGAITTDCNNHAARA
jgi:hypothetical protein